MNENERVQNLCTLEHLSPLTDTHCHTLSLSHSQVDVEGYEPEVMGSATRLIASRQAAHVFTEYSPGER